MDKSIIEEKLIMWCEGYTCKTLYKIIPDFICHIKQKLKIAECTGNMGGDPKVRTN